MGSDLSVAVVYKAVPCSGATGAVAGKFSPFVVCNFEVVVIRGQGHLWMLHKTPSTHICDLAIRGHRLWVMLAEQGLDPLQHLVWKNKGSILIGGSPEELDAFQGRVNFLRDSGLRAEYLSGCWVKSSICLVVNMHFSSEGRHVEFFYDPVTSLFRCDSSEEVVAVKTSKNTLHSKKAIVVAAGCWSGSLMHDLFREAENVLDAAVKPRKGHLLVLENFDSFKVNHGLMEAGYVNRQTATTVPRTLTSEAFDHGQTLYIAMTATMDAMGNLVLVPDRKQVIGQVPGLPNVSLATVHGGGLSVALGTAEMVADMVPGNSEEVILHLLLFKADVVNKTHSRHLSIPPSSIEIFLIAHNQLTGEVPSLICSLNSIEVLGLADDSLNDNLPPGIGNFSCNLSVLDMQINKQTGLIAGRSLCWGMNVEWYLKYYWDT
ncbi:hypothetical protein FEM48_Zijuj09G0210500 [Ziziphus jujuba var. spinosa]|uniref:FAD-dependent oxidoreductase domain-containing protein 1 n=1 Tax=Ziziphus jujuba var. spinosa TaxID=714518 RepID=A0A978UVB0_ZIZJJ|nr:hypothetical protein FEM48_Zijuj09G0210500 [Ziziphus jujuba var. spinosa]